MRMDYTKAEEMLRASYRDVAEQYRRDDEIEVTTENHRSLCAVLESLSASFGRPSKVLDVGCGTGRYFHALKNVQRLVGIDVSPEMLEAARHPVKEEEITIEQIELVCGNIFLMSVPSASYDLIYSLGMFGHGCPVTVEVCNKFHDMLVPGGKVFFNVVSVSGLALTARLRKKARNVCYAVAPGPLKEAMDRREHGVPFFGLTKGQLASILESSRFNEFEISERRCDSPLWEGTHLECLAVK